MSEPDLAPIAAAVQSGDWPAAERLAGEQLDAFPRHEKLLALRAMSLQVQGRLDDAIEAYGELTAAHPGSSAHWNNQASVLYQAGDRVRAAAACAEAIRRDPRNPWPHLTLGLVRLDARDPAGARASLLDAFERAPQAARIRIHAARACSLCQDFQGVEDLLRPWRDWLPLGDAALQVELANLLLATGDAVSARMLLEEVVRERPDDHAAALFLAHVEERFNELDAAERRVEGVLAVVESGTAARVEALQLQALLALRRGDARAAQALLEQAGPRDDRDAQHAFRLADCADRLGQHALAMQALDRAHALQSAEQRSLTPDWYVAGAPALPAVMPRVTSAQYARWPRHSAPAAAASPVFVVGFPRSGTTLLEQMLDAHPALQSMDENPFFTRLADTLRRHDARVMQDLGVLRQYDVDGLRQRYDALVAQRIARHPGTQLVDKNPLNLLWLPLMHRLYPAARNILCVRHPCDVILSCYRQNFRSSILIAACSTLERLAHAYVEAMDTWQAHAGVFGSTVLVTRHEDLVADIGGEARRIADFLQLDDTAPMLAFDRHARDKGFIGTPSYSQVVEPVNRKGVGRWLAYRPWFEPLLPILAPLLERWGYAAEGGVRSSPQAPATTGAPLTR